MSQGTGAEDLRAAIADRRRVHDVTVAELDNGMRIIVREDRRSPVAICQVWVRVGSNREPDDLRGWAHGMEHMLFKGTGRRGEGDFANEVASAGGSTNAGTGYETTSYHVVVPAAELPTACDILGDALLNSAFTAEALDPERQVLVHENHMYDDIPSGFGKTWKLGLETTFDVSPYRFHIGGEDEELLSAPRERIIEFYRSAYRPDNMTAVIVGDVDADEAIEQIREHFVPPTAPDGHPPLPQPPVEPQRHETRLRLERGDIKQAYAKLIFPAPAETDRRRPALSVLRRILAEGRSCRLFRRLREETELVTDISLLAEAGPREGVLMVDLETDPQRLVDAVVETVRVLEELKTVPPGDDELDKARVRVQRSFLFGAETVQGRSSTIGYYDAMGDLEGAFVFPDRVAAVTADDIGELCRGLFRLDNLTALFYVPQDVDADAAGIPTSAEDLRGILDGTLSDGTALDHDPMSASTETVVTTTAPPKTVSAADFVETTLTGGCRVCCRVDRSLPVVSLGIFSPGGAGAESGADAGLAYLTQQVQVKGAGDLSAETLHRRIEEEGATLSANADRDFGGLYVTGLSDRLDRVLGWMGDVVCRPLFSEEEVDRERRLALEELRTLADDSFQHAALNLRRLIYGDHPYGRPLLGTETSLQAMTRDDLVARWRRGWTAQRLSIVVSGDVDPDSLLPRLEELLAAVPDDDMPVRAELPPITPPRGIIRETITRDMPQSVVLAGWPGAPDVDTDRIGLLMLKEVLNGQSGRLFEALRNRQSLCYNTGLLSTAGFGQGFIAGYILTDPTTAEKALRGLCDEAARLADDLVPEIEFERARAKLTGNLLIASQANSARVSRCGRDLLYGRGANELPRLLETIAAATPQDVRDVAGKYIDPENRFEVVLGV